MDWMGIEELAEVFIIFYSVFELVLFSELIINSLIIIINDITPNINVLIMIVIDIMIILFD
jgi:hypothetical protein